MAPKSKSYRAGLQFPVSRFQRYLRKGRYAPRIGVGSAVYMAAVLEYLVAEILELSGNAARDNRKKTIKPRHVQLAIRNDVELNVLLKHVTISQGGVMPNIHPVLIPRTKPMPRNFSAMVALIRDSNDGDEVVKKKDTSIAEAETDTEVSDENWAIEKSKRN